MAQLRNQPLLTLCIPIFNRLKYLERQFERMIEDKDLFDEQIQLIISDNCSVEDLKSCCEKYRRQGLNFLYNRHDTNLGADGNFDWCFHHAEGKYVWLLGSDDILEAGILRKIITVLEQDDFGLVHLSLKPKDNKLTVFQSSGEMVVEVNYGITFISSNIILTNSIKTVDLKDFYQTLMIQVPAYLNACVTNERNAIIYENRFFQIDNDGFNNGGYNLFQVFVGNLFCIYHSFIDSGQLSKRAFYKFKKIIYRDFLVKYIVELLIKRRNRNFLTHGSWRILAKHYGLLPYAYYYLIKLMVKQLFSKCFKRLFRNNN